MDHIHAEKDVKIIEKDEYREKRKKRQKSAWTFSHSKTTIFNLLSLWVNHKWERCSSPNVNT